MAKKVKVVVKPVVKAKAASSSSSKSGGSSKGGGGKSNIEGQLKAVQKSLEKAMKPGKEETAATKALGDLDTSKTLGLNKIKSEPQAMPFITGQSRELERSVEDKAMPLKVQLAALQARRQASVDVARSKKGFLESAISRKASASKAASDAEMRGLQKEKLKASVNKLNAPKSTRKTDPEMDSLKKENLKLRNEKLKKGRSL